MKTATAIIALLAFRHTQASAQQAIIAAGGDAIGSGGTMSYTIGQIDYITLDDAGGIATQGVQQPYEIYPVSIAEQDDIALEYCLYPNPTRASVTLVVTPANLSDLFMRLYDLQGNLILEQRITDVNTILPLEELSSATYLLVVSNPLQELQQFRIIKNK
jgi:Secretion system C-terminal sorting domain